MTTGTSARPALRTVLERLKAAGMGSLPGGGAEILVDRVRKALTVNKVLTEATQLAPVVDRFLRDGAHPTQGSDPIR